MNDPHDTPGIVLRVLGDTPFGETPSQHGDGEQNSNTDGPLSDESEIAAIFARAYASSAGDADNVGETIVFADADADPVVVGFDALSHAGPADVGIDPTFGSGLGFGFDLPVAAALEGPPPTDRRGGIDPHPSNRSENGRSIEPGTGARDDGFGSAAGDPDARAIAMPPTDPDARARREGNVFAGGCGRDMPSAGAGGARFNVLDFASAVTPSGAEVLFGNADAVYGRPGRNDLFGDAAAAGRSPADGDGGLLERVGDDLLSTSPGKDFETVWDDRRVGTPTAVRPKRDLFVLPEAVVHARSPAGPLAPNADAGGDEPTGAATVRTAEAPGRPQQAPPRYEAPVGEHLGDVQAHTPPKW